MNKATDAVAVDTEGGAITVTLPHGSAGIPVTVRASPGDRFYEPPPPMTFAGCMVAIREMIVGQGRSETAFEVKVAAWHHVGTGVCAPAWSVWVSCLGKHLEGGATAESLVAVVRAALEVEPASRLDTAKVDSVAMGDGPTT